MCASERERKRKKRRPRVISKCRTNTHTRTHAHKRRGSRTLDLKSRRGRSDRRHTTFSRTRSDRKGRSSTASRHGTRRRSAHVNGLACGGGESARSSPDPPLLATTESSPGSSPKRLSRLHVQRKPDATEHARPLTSLAFFRSLDK